MPPLLTSSSMRVHSCGNAIVNASVSTRYQMMSLSRKPAISAPSPWPLYAADQSCMNT